MLSVLIIDDDVEFCSMLRDYMARHQVQLSMSHNGAEGLSAIQSGNYDLVLLDIMLPELNGLAVLQSLPCPAPAPVILLTAQSGDQERIQGLDLGADDYITKPINPRELVARIHAVLRRSVRLGSAPVVATQAPSLDPTKRCLRVQQQSIQLTDVEYSILEALMASPGEVMTRDHLVRQVFQRDFHPMDRSLDMHISRLRKKLDVVKHVHLSIRSVRNMGYALLQDAGGFDSPLSPVM